jgi:hypothetical protein
MVNFAAQRKESLNAALSGAMRWFLALARSGFEWQAMTPLSLQPRHQRRCPEGFATFDSRCL